ncbi:deoxyribose-phosphate aldolase [bacterium]|jgi:deoxyribose-phosphate aldolase|nr:deoxyribose-phosphate aldolase [bacterium]
MDYNQLIDHTLLKPEASQEAIAKLCLEAKEYNFYAVCVNPCYVKFCTQQLKGSRVKVCTVIGFPLGATTSETKAFETSNALDNGADEIDMVINVGALKAGFYDYVYGDIKAVVKAAKGRLVKVIIETCLLSDEEKVQACKLALEAGADFVKTSTGFSTGGATVHDVSLMRKTVGDKLGVKASGGIRSREDLEALVQAGASRIGTSSGVKLCSK